MLSIVALTATVLARIMTTKLSDSVLTLGSYYNKVFLFCLCGDSHYKSVPFLLFLFSSTGQLVFEVDRLFSGIGQVASRLFRFLWKEG
jgi:hypothetical protein